MRKVVANEFRKGSERDTSSDNVTLQRPCSDLVLESLLNCIVLVACSRGSHKTVFIFLHFIIH